LAPWPKRNIPIMSRKVTKGLGQVALAISLAMVSDFAYRFAATKSP
jgi:hypothetical protein